MDETRKLKVTDHGTGSDVSDNKHAEVTAHLGGPQRLTPKPLLSRSGRLFAWQSNSNAPYQWHGLFQKGRKQAF